MKWASQNGIVKGYDNGSFGVGDKITVEQTIVILYRYAQFAGIKTAAGGTLEGYGDGGSVSPWAAEAMSWALDCGIYAAGVDGSLNPVGEASRALVAQILYNYSVYAEGANG